MEYLLTDSNGLNEKAEFQETPLIGNKLEYKNSIYKVNDVIHKKEIIELILFKINNDSGDIEAEWG